MHDLSDSPLPLMLLDTALRGGTLALLLQLALAIWLQRWQVPVARLAVAMALGLAVQVAGSAPVVDTALPRAWLAPVIGVSVGNAALFWLFARALLDDDFVLRPWHRALWAAVFAMGWANCALHDRLPPDLLVASLALQRWMPAVFALLAAGVALSRWRADLVERRRWLRGFIVVAGIGYSLAMVAARLGAQQGALTGGPAMADAAGLLLMSAVVSARLLYFKGGDLFPSRVGGVAAATDAPVDENVPVPSTAQRPMAPSPSTAADEMPPAPDPAEDRLALALGHAMTAEHAYRDEDLSVASLAARLAVPEYKLRRLINQRLGHRNFNAYVNGFRLQQARQALADPQRATQSVLSIALEAGFQSIGPFNRAFKADTGLTPTEFRSRSGLADS